MKSSEIFKYGKALPGHLVKLETISGTWKSVYTDTGAAKLSISVWKALHLYALAKNADSLPAETKVKSFKKLSVAEYITDKKANAIYIASITDVENDTIQYATYSTEDGAFKAGTYNTVSDTMETYTVGPSAHDGTVLIAAMIPVILSGDREAYTLFTTIEKDLLYLPESDYWLSDNESFNKGLITLCDNIYRRIVYPSKTGSAGIITKFPTTANFTRIKKDTVDSILRLGKVIVGTAGSSTATASTTAHDDSDFDGSYALDPSRVWTEDEQHLIPHIQPWYVVPDWVRNICKKFLKSSVMTTPMRNALLKGVSGTGKTEGARAIFAGLGIPYTKTTCSVDSEIFDFLGQVFPGTDDTPLSYTELLVKYDLPTVEDIMFDLPGSYTKLTGETTLPEGYDQAECISLLFEKVMAITASIKENNKDFRYVESELVKAIRNGYGHEIQEPTVIKRAGVLVGLNALFENGDNNFITLPTGEVVKKHPNCCIILTTNSDYEGCAILNQSVLSRMDIVMTIGTPPAEEMKRRIIEKTGFDNEDVLDRMIYVVNQINEHCKANDITDGTCGMRELESWVKAVMIEAESTLDIDDSLVYEEALYTIIAKATQNSDDEAELIDSCLRLKFAA